MALSKLIKEVSPLLIAASIAFIIPSVGSRMMEAGKRDQAERVLKDQYAITDIDLSWSVFGCNAYETFSFKFSGVRKGKTPVEGFACSGYLSGVSVRFK